jgi:hypothetical protein
MTPVLALLLSEFMRSAPFARRFMVCARSLALGYRSGTGFGDFGFRMPRVTELLSLLSFDAAYEIIVEGAMKPDPAE